ncbi:MAG: glycerate kinase family protein [Marinifilaceae bacterium]
MKIIVACDSFKGSLTSEEIANVIKSTLKTEEKIDSVVGVAIADGGEGTLDAIAAWSTECVEHLCVVHNPIGAPICARYLGFPKQNRAFVELAVAAGLTLLNEEQRNPLITSTYGVGEIIRQAIEQGYTNITLTLGGSATNDAGVGMLQALGFSFLDEAGVEVEAGGAFLERIVEIKQDKVMPALAHCTFTVACDVENPLSGENGAAFVFAKQKGASDEMIGLLDNGLQHFATILEEYCGVSPNKLSGAGAAGGVGASVMLLLGATYQNGIATILEFMEFEKIVIDADVVITGEGKMDRQTLMGKAPYGILRIAEKRNVPVVAIAGIVEDWQLLNEAGFKAIFPIVSGPMSLMQAMSKRETTEGIARTVTQIMNIMAGK